MYLFIIAGAIFVYMMYEIDSARKKSGMPGVPVFGVIFDSIGFNVRESFDEEGKSKKKHKHHHHHKKHSGKGSHGSKKSGKSKKQCKHKHKKDKTGGTKEKTGGEGSISEEKPNSANPTSQSTHTGRETYEIFNKTPEPEPPANV